VEALERDLAGMGQNEGSKFREGDFSVGIGVHSEQIPEDIVELILCSFVEDLNHKSFQLRLHQEALGAFIIPIEVDLQLVPESRDESQFLFGNVRDSRNNRPSSHSRHSSDRGWLWLCQKVNSIPEIFPDELDILLECNKPIFVCIQLSKNE